MAITLKYFKENIHCNLTPKNFFQSEKDLVLTIL